MVNEFFAASFFSVLLREGSSKGALIDGEYNVFFCSIKKGVYN